MNVAYDLVISNPGSQTVSRGMQPFGLIFPFYLLDIEPCRSSPIDNQCNSRSVATLLVVISRGPPLLRYIVKYNLGQGELRRLVLVVPVGNFATTGR